jgi:hypothetical protein
MSFKLLTAFYLAAIDFSLCAVISLDKVRPFDDAIHPYFLQEFVNPYLRDMRRSSATDNFLAFVDIHHSHLRELRFHGVLHQPASPV